MLQSTKQIKILAIMCGRIGFGTATWKEVLAILTATAPSGSEALYRPRYNVAPAQQHWIVRQEGDRRLFEPAVWGFRGSKGLLINARSETAHRLPTFRKAFAESRCLVPADGFYEWQGGKGKRQPLWFYSREGLLLMAGLYRHTEDGSHFVVLTTAANDAMKSVHDRMPALLSHEDALAWLARPVPLFFDLHLTIGSNGVKSPHG